jgi:vancomycin resistance protein YoaR
MSTISFPARPRPARSQPLLIEQILLAILAGFLIFFAVSVLTFVGTRLWYVGRILPGVTVNGVNIGGMSPRQAAVELVVKITYPISGKIVLRDNNRIWVASPGELGLALDPEATAQAAMRIGRSGFVTDQIREQINTASSGQDISPVYIYDQRAAFRYLESIAKKIDHPAVDASLSLNGTDVVVTPGQAGRTLDIPNSLALIGVQLQTQHDGALNLFVKDSSPVILDASAEADLARKILSAPLTLDLPGDEAGHDGAPWTLDVPTLANMLVIEKTDTPGGQRYQVRLREDMLRGYLAEIAPKLVRSPANARFIFNDDTKQLEVLQHSVRGRQMDVEKTVQTIQEKLRSGDHTIALEMIYQDPAVPDTMTGQQLGITELVHSETSYFRGSAPERVQNITAAAAKFHGLLVAPGETFSMASAIGDITLDNGFAEALIIVGGQTIKGVGGGVCQVSTTLFRAAFFTGFPIVERHPHAYRVGYYEQNSRGGHDTNLAGLDATVYVPLVDLKFTNDTPYWLLMETYINGYSLTWKFYSTSDGRSVDWSTTGPTNIVPPPDPIYRENPDLAQGQIKQVDWAVQGADVSVSRTVSKNGSVYFTDQINTHYEAWQDVYEYGPGTDISSLQNGSGSSH